MLARPVFIYALIAASSIAFVSTGLRFNLDASAWASWVQAVGSITALGVAIFVMSRQNRYARDLMREADRLAVFRRASAVHAIVKRAHGQYMVTMRMIGQTTPTTLDEEARVERELRAAGHMITAMHKAILAIPTHELGSFDLAEGVHRIGELFHAFAPMLEQMANSPSEVGTNAAILAKTQLVATIDLAIQQFDRGLANLR